MALPYGSVKYTSGNIALDQADVLVNTVNCRLSASDRGVMGAGVAKAFMLRGCATSLDCTRRQC